MKPKAIIRNIVILAIVLAVGYFGYKMFFKGSTASGTTSSSGLSTTAGVNTSTDAMPSTGTTPMSPVGSDFLATLLSVRSLTLDDKIFTNPAFTSLQDFSRPLLPDTDPGRPNPFAPLGADISGISTQISTTNASAITGTTSTVNGTLAVGDATVMRWFAYGPTQALGQTTTPKPQTTPGAFAENITGLTPNTTYYAKAMATIAGQAIAGNVVTWTTAQTKR